jgi:ethanolaminephosphotransferase
MVTLLGLISLFSPIPIILYYDFQSLKTLPTWVYFYLALSVFLGQTFDAIDGKHARKTKRSSPLGQFMDHGCDAFSNSFIVVMGSQAYRLGQGIYPILIQILVQVWIHSKI